MRSLLYVLALLCCGSLSAQVSVQFLPAKPIPGQPITVVVNGDSIGLPPQDSQVAVVYLLEMDQVPVAQEIKLVRNGIYHTGNFTTQPGTLAVAIGFPTRLYIKDADPHTYLYGNDSRPLPGARRTWGQAAQRYGNLWAKEMSIAESQQLALEDMALHKAYLKATYPQYYLFTLTLSDKPEDRAQLQQEIDRLIDNPVTPESDLDYIKYLYTRIKQPQRKAGVDSVILARYPTGKVYRFYRVAAFWNEEENPEKMEVLYGQLLKDLPPVTPADSIDFDRYCNGLSAAWLAKDSIAKAEWYAHRIRDNRQRAVMYHDIAEKLAGENIHGKPINVSLSEKYVQEAMALQQALLNNTNGKPAYLTEAGWKHQLHNTYLAYTRTYALLLYHRKQYQQAYDWQEKTMSVFSYTTTPYEAFAVYSEKVKGAVATQPFLEQCVRTGKASPAMKAALKKTYLLKHTEQQWDGYYNGLKTELLARLRTKLSQEILQETAPDFTLKDLDGKEVSMSSLKGKVVVLDFWGTWCGPCVASFPAMKMAKEKFKQDPNVVFLFVDAREKGTPQEVNKKVASFLQKNNYPFRVLLDLDDAVVNSFKVPGFPTKYIIDGNGLIRFMEAGFGGSDENLTDQITAMIELAREAGAGSGKRGF
ncbi:TlpA family protein disulfide reductase [Paraflavitalea pollutisoli]|uniref:TlpA family protein disulfide reductase n=1 Tax=Paraflavitalea pollutisoli TaxID=3034143 RepID=UPI0023EE0B41|nr:TlpA disulfide reductase family protein [Paraflavitalea sp. H1-2-19X]